MQSLQNSPDIRWQNTSAEEHESKQAQMTQSLIQGQYSGCSEDANRREVLVVGESLSTETICSKSALKERRGRARGVGGNAGRCGLSVLCPAEPMDKTHELCGGGRLPERYKARTTQSLIRALEANAEWLSTTTDAKSRLLE